MGAPELVRGGGAPRPLGASIVADGVNFAVYSSSATQIWVSIFDERDAEIAMLPLENFSEGVHYGLVAGIGAGARYGLRAEGRYAPAEGYWFDPAKLLVDPYAKRLDRRFVLDPRLCLPRSKAADSAPAVPKAFVTAPEPSGPVRGKRAPSLIYELNVRGQTMLHPEVPAKLRGTFAGLAEPAMLDHLVRLGVDTVELMPIAAWIDDRHLAGLGLTNFWGYNPIAPMAPDPCLAPGGIADLRALTDAYAEAGIAVVLDVVFNHTGESDVLGPTLSFRGLDNLTYYRHTETSRGLELVNDAGTGNVLACDRAPVVDLVMATLRHWVAAAGVAGFRFDLATVLGRGDFGFDTHAPLLEAIRADKSLANCLLIAEPWDVGPGGYQLGRFGPRMLEWNDAWRDDVRRYWRGDGGATGAFATRLAGSADHFGAGGDLGRSVNFIAAHDGFTLADLVAFSAKRNLANLEGNRDGADHNFSWNNGIEGATTDPDIIDRRRADIRALLATLFVSRGTAMLTAGNELGATQAGNNNAYSQDNPIAWIDWARADPELVAFTAGLARLRRKHKSLTATKPLTGKPDRRGRRDCIWLKPDGSEMDEAAWRAADAVLGLLLNEKSDTVLIWFNRGRAAASVTCPPAPRRTGWRLKLASSPAALASRGALRLSPRSVALLAPRSPGRAVFRRGNR
ncbi:MAG: glycogen debranching protein GlgX [Cucumibacter sp.]